MVFLILSFILPNSMWNGWSGKIRGLYHTEQLGKWMVRYDKRALSYPTVGKMDGPVR
ncbi:hypothetical protein V7121_00775 [Neobacillus drentensis]